MCLAETKHRSLIARVYRKTSYGKTWLASAEYSTSRIDAGQFFFSIMFCKSMPSHRTNQYCCWISSTVASDSATVMVPIFAPNLCHQSRSNLARFSLSHMDMQDCQEASALLQSFLQETSQMLHVYK